LKLLQASVALPSTLKVDAEGRSHFEVLFSSVEKTDEVKLRPSKRRSPVMEQFNADRRDKSKELIKRADAAIKAAQENVQTSRELVMDSKRLRRG
jgi:hypothetical protein